MSRFPFISSDAALVRRALADEPRAFETLVCRYQRRAHAIARAAGVRADSAEDVVQEAFLHAFRGLRNLRAPGSFGSWFMRIVRNLSLRDRQARGLPVDLEVVDADTLAAPPSRVNEVKEERELLCRSWCYFWHPRYGRRTSPLLPRTMLRVEQ